MSRPTIPGYVIMDVRGVGAMATVYRATHLALCREVALKVLHASVARDADYRERFLREARAAARLSHGNVVRAYESGVAPDGSCWFAMELVVGEDLNERLSWASSLPEGEALDIAIGVCRGLAAAEAHGLIHRDVKPENVLLGEDGSVKLADLGLARAEGDASITADGYTLGTVAFLSPEQCVGRRDLDARADLWSLGATLYTALAGAPPYGRGENPPVTMKRILEEDPPPIESKATVSPATAAVVRALMARDRERRPRTAADALALLERARAALASGAEAPRAARDGEPAPRGDTARRPRVRPRRGPGRSSGVPIVVAAILAAIVGLVLGVLLRQQGPPSRGIAPRIEATTAPAALAAPVAPAATTRATASGATAGGAR